MHVESYNEFLTNIVDYKSLLIFINLQQKNLIVSEIFRIFAENFEEHNTISKISLELKKSIIQTWKKGKRNTAKRSST